MKRFLIIFALAVVVIIGLAAIDFWLFSYFGDSLIGSLISMILRLLGLTLLGFLMIVLFE